MAGSTAAQAASREAILRGEVARRLGRPDVPVALRATPQAFHDRQRARFTVRSGTDGALRAGFMGASSHAFVAAERCAIVRPAIAEALPGLLASLPRDFDGRLTVLSGAPADRIDAPEVAPEVVAAWAEPRGGAAFPLGPERVVVPFGPYRQPMAPAAFAQANPEITAQILAEVTDLLHTSLGSAPAPHAAELFAGSGTLTHALWAAGCTVDAWEVDEAAREAFAQAAARAATAGHVAASDSRWSACDLLATGLVTPPPRRPPDVILLDPPRTGARELVPWLRRPPARLMLYLACDLAPALRDLQELLTPRDADPTPPWRLERAISYDMFPHSGHQEVLFVLTRAL
jgi:23S rRNA (uracil1939-C5)-methyltransferase